MAERLAAEEAAREEAERTASRATVIEAAAPSAPDDLEVIEGIGPKIAQVLADAGITTFAQLAQTDVETLNRIVREEAGITIAFPDTWPRQAQFAADGDMDGMYRYQEELQAGRVDED